MKFLVVLVKYLIYLIIGYVLSNLIIIPILYETLHVIGVSVNMIYGNIIVFVFTLSFVLYMKRRDLKKVLDNSVKVYNVEDIGRPYEVLTSINAKGWKQEKAKLNLQRKAHDLGADAIVSYSENIATHSHISSSRGGLMGMGMGNVKSVSGGSSNEFHVQGTAVKYTTADVTKDTKNIGKIMTYNSATGEGMIMLSNGEKISFNINMWEDQEHLPEVGMKELNVYNDNGKVKITTKDHKIESLEN